jgi:hypothetical protein
MTFDAAWQQVTCRDCKRTYTCTPEADYFGDAGGMNPETTPVRVIDLTGAGTDPRDLSRKPGGSKS